MHKHHAHMLLPACACTCSCDDYQSIAASHKSHSTAQAALSTDHARSRSRSNEPCVTSNGGSSTIQHMGQSQAAIHLPLTQPPSLLGQQAVNRCWSCTLCTDAARRAASTLCFSASIATEKGARLGAGTLSPEHLNISMLRTSSNTCRKGKERRRGHPLHQCDSVSRFTDQSHITTTDRRIACRCCA